MMENGNYYFVCFVCLGLRKNFQLLKSCLWELDSFLPLTHVKSTCRNFNHVIVVPGQGLSVNMTLI